MDWNEPVVVAQRCEECVPEGLGYVRLLWVVSLDHNNYNKMHRNSQSSSDYESEEETKKVKPRKKIPLAKTPSQKVMPKPKISINLSDCQYPVVRSVSKTLKWKAQTDPENAEWDVWWTDNAVAPEVVFKMQPHQKINHFPGMYILSRKNLLGKGLMRMRKEFPEDYKFFPLTWMLPSEFSEFRLYYQSKPKGKSRTYIVKPQAMSQGKGIFLTRRIEDLEPGEHYVIQRYMHRPYLIDNLKFDFRIYVLLAGVDPLRIYVFNEGLARFATETYVVPSRQNMEEVCMHLTNYAINKDSPNFVFNTSQNNMSVGHKRSLSSVYELLDKQGVSSTQLKSKINDILIKTIMTGLPSIRHQYRSCQSQNYAANMCFEVLGFDVLLNHKAEPCLLEINYTPSFTTDTPLDESIKFNLIHDTLVLMNINVDTRQEIITKRREECNQRVITGKKIKLSPEEREALRREAQKQRNVFEDSHLGGYEKVYPLEDQEKMNYYGQFLEYAEKHYYESTGIKRKTVEEKPKPSTTKPVGGLPIRRGKSTNTTVDSSKVSDSIKLSQTYYNKRREKEKVLPLIEEKISKALTQEKPKQEVKEQLKSSTDTAKFSSKKEIIYSNRQCTVSNMAPSIINNINLNFYFEPPKNDIHSFQKRTSNLTNPSFGSRHHF